MARTVRPARSRIGKHSLMNVQEALVVNQVAQISKVNGWTVQHTMALAIDMLFQSEGIPAFAASMDWDDNPSTIPADHVEDIVLEWGIKEQFEILVGPRKKKFELMGDKAFPCIVLGTTLKPNALTAFQVAMAVADRDAKLAAYEAGGSKGPFIEFRLDQAARIDVECVRVSDGKVVGSRKGGVLGYLLSGGRWGEWGYDFANKEPVFNVA